ncbi:DUF2846 domain-containing protein, partial [bacterium]|nr:DUF2846 domain-containing protein [bacterium]
MKRNLLIAISLLTLLISGCASVPMAPMDEDVKAKTFSTLPEKASLYIYRHESFGGAIPMSLSVNGKSIGQTAAKTYFRLNLAPGKYSVESHAENVSNLSLNME